DVAAALGEAGTAPVTEPEPAEDEEGAARATSADPEAGTAGSEAATAGPDDGEPATADAADDGAGATPAAGGGDGSAGESPGSLRGHVRAVIADETGRARLLDDEFAVLDEVDAADAFDAVEGADAAPFALVLDGELDQRLLDVAAQRGVEHVVARSTGEFVKRPVDVRVRTADQLTS
ncbi:MAG: DNA primase, partial [Haloferacaceae archaeon]